MSKYKQQHWLPLAYLKGFHCGSPVSNARKSQLWRFDGTKPHKVPAKSQCRGKYLYSRSSPKSAESDFHRMEGDFPAMVQKLQSGQEVRRREEIGMIFIMFVMHFRNGAYANRTGKERIEAFRMAINTFFREEISKTPKGVDTIKAVLRGLIDNWRLGKVVCKEAELITSDHPAILLSTSGKDVTAVMLPLTPQVLAFGYDQRKITVTSKQGTLKDTANLNALQATQSILAVYSSVAFPEEDLGKLKTVFDTKRREEREYFDKKSLVFDFVRFPRGIGKEFSFLAATAE